MKDTFNIQKCNLRGCQQNIRTACRLEGLPIFNYIDSMQFFRDSHTCKVRQQISIYKTEQLIGKD